MERQGRAIFKLASGQTFQNKSITNGRAETRKNRSTSYFKQSASTPGSIDPAADPGFITSARL